MAVAYRLLPSTVRQLDTFPEQKEHKNDPEQKMGDRYVLHTNGRTMAEVDATCPRALSVI